jgi:hypothetical protein
MRTLIAVPLTCLLVLITRAPEAVAAELCPSPQEMEAILQCWERSDLVHMPRCSGA